MEGERERREGSENKKGGEEGEGGRSDMEGEKQTSTVFLPVNKVFGLQVNHPFADVLGKVKLVLLGNDSSSS